MRLCFKTILLSVFFVFCIGCSGQGSTIVGNPSISGTVQLATGQAIPGATVYIPGAPSLDIKKSQSRSKHLAFAECSEGSISCEDPPENACATTCSCADGSYSLNIDNCPTDFKLVRFCSQGICSEVRATCNSSDGSCSLNLVQNQTSGIANGTWFSVDNNCASLNNEALLIFQNGSSLALNGSFASPTINETISENNVQFNLQESSGNLACTATIVGEILDGSCDVCGTFTYTKNISGSYQLISNNCEDDESNLVISQNGNILNFTGGFDYQIGSPDTYNGLVQSIITEPISFTINGSDSTANCTAVLNEQVDLVGSCQVTGAQAEVCDFSYSLIPN